MQVMCDCGRTLNPEGYCDASHALSAEQYAEMLERRQQIELAATCRKINNEQSKNQRH
jgi:CDGSH-type Zn-finger protein